jgi:predicted small metal-binding protein
MKSFECRHAGVVCKAKVSGATEDEVLAKAVEHAKKAHGVDLTVSTTLANFARSTIYDEPSGARS